MNELALRTNAVLAETPVFSMLSDFGRRIYVPMGLTEQSNQALEMASLFNATAGIAKENGHVVSLDCMNNFFSGLSPDQSMNYATLSGNLNFRQIWKKDLLYKNPDLAGKNFTLPAVAGGITHALNIVFSLFLDKGEKVIMPSLYWDNYDLLIEEQRLGEKVLYPLFSSASVTSDFVNCGASEPEALGLGFNIDGLDNAISSCKDEKVVVLLNFPNNPTGFSPRVSEAFAIRDVLVKHAELGKKIVAVLDDAYYSLFFEKDVYPQSLFTLLCDAHENILAVKCDGPTKENMSWGMRIACVTAGSKNLKQRHLDAVMQKLYGAIRSTVSSCNNSAQNVLAKAMEDPCFISQRQAGIEKIRIRYLEARRAVDSHASDKWLRLLPCNSGYFMCFETVCDAEKLRVALLEQYGAGIIRIDSHHIRFAFCSVEPEKIAPAIDLVYRVARLV